MIIINKIPKNIMNNIRLDCIKYKIHKNKKYINATSHEIKMMDDEGTIFIIYPSGLCVRVESEYIKDDEEKTEGVDLYKIKYKKDPKYNEIMSWLNENFPDIILLGSILASIAYENIYALKIVDGYEKASRSEKVAYWDKFIKMKGGNYEED